MVIEVSANMVFNWEGLMKVVVSGFILMLQKWESHIFLSVGVGLSMMLASVRVLVMIDIGVRGLMFLWDLSISNLKKLVMSVRNKLGFWFGKFAMALIGSTISRTSIAFRMFKSIFQTGLTWGQS